MAIDREKLENVQDKFLNASICYISRKVLKEKQCFFFGSNIINHDSPEIFGVFKSSGNKETVEFSSLLIGFFNSVHDWLQFKCDNHQSVVVNNLLIHARWHSGFPSFFPLFPFLFITCNFAYNSMEVD